jgi:hypothetical protein
MRKKYLIIGSLVFSHLFAIGQVSPDTLKEKISFTEIELVYNHYIQDGNNSAVTGGIGTEKLTVYGPGLTIRKTLVKNNSVALNTGVDIITSASTDNIDYVMSSASRTDTRTYANVIWEHTFEKPGLSVYGGLGFSIESDYFSIGTEIGVRKENKMKLRSYSVQFQMYNDDLRWGRENGNYLRPVKLIYPVELRFKEWYDNYRRNSYNLKLDFTQALNQRNIIGIYPEITYQEGLLSTPFHRIYFSDSTKAVEQLPEQRWKGALALRLNSFTGGKLILKNIINCYADNFGILAFSVENETAIKIKHDLYILPNVRIYSQTSSTYFAPHGTHKSNEKYYTSDFDLSQLQTYNAGIGIKFNPFKYINKRLIFNEMLIRYNFLCRSNNLTAHIISFVIQTGFHKKSSLSQSD